jgi:hypothetical protein
LIAFRGIDIPSKKSYKKLILHFNTFCNIFLKII